MKLKLIDLEYYKDKNIYVEYLDFKRYFILVYKNTKTKYFSVEKLNKKLNKLGYQGYFNIY